MMGHRGRVGTQAWSSHLLTSGSRDRNILQRDIRAPEDFQHKLLGHRSEVSILCELMNCAIHKYIRPLPRSYALFTQVHRPAWCIATRTHNMTGPKCGQQLLGEGHAACMHHE